MEHLVIYQYDGKKIRIGPSQDGGYVIADNLEYDCLVSCGIGNDLEFEKKFTLINPHLEYFTYDGTIDKLPEEVENVKFIKKNITYYNSETTTNLFDIFDKYNNIFLKMDIETYEFRWLQVLSVEQLKKIKQIIIEFHFPFTEPGFTHLDTPLPVDQKLSVLKKLAETHTLIHLHPNNCCSTVLFNSITVPNVFECTYVRKDVQIPNKLNVESLPTSLDRPNVPGRDIYLTGYPFTV